MGANLKISVRTPADLERLGGYLHDAVFKTESVVWSQNESEASMRFWREADEIPSRPLFRLLPFVHTRRFRRAECVVQWRSVRQLVSRERDRLDYHCVTEIQTSMVEGVQKIEFVTESAMDLYLLVDELDAECRDTGEVTENQFGLTTLALRRFPRTKPAGADRTA